MNSISTAVTDPLGQTHSGVEFDLKRRQVEAMERANTIAESSTAQARRMERKKYVMKAKSINDNLTIDIPKLNNKITEIDVGEWSTKDDNSISKGMRKLGKWEDELKDIIKMLRQLVDLKNVYNILENEVKCEDTANELHILEMTFNEVKENLEAEDEDRGLYSLEKPKTTSINLPTFSGKDFEDFSKFKLDMEDGFKTNRISKKEQIQKLRECLNGQARKLVPDSNVTDLGTAWEVLHKAYGNPIKIIRHRKEALLKLGEMPSDRVEGQNDLWPQIAWFLDITTFLKELIELGKKNSEYRDLAFAQDFAAQLRRSFPTNLCRKLRKCEGEGLELFENMLVKIEEFREDAQEDQHDIDITKPIVSHSEGENNDSSILGSTIGYLHGQINPGPVKRKKMRSRSLHGPAGAGKKLPRNASYKNAKVLEMKEDLNENVSKNGKGFTKKISRKINRSPKNKSTKEASRILKRKISTEDGPNIILKPIPKGRAQFMIGQTKGKSRPLNTLYDSGCYALLLKEGVQKELGKSVLKTRGPFHVNGVGNTTVTVNDEWMTSLPLCDGSRQIVEGWTVDEVTGYLPQADLSEAVTELKNDDNNNTKLQKMFVKLVTGGQVDILLGTMYNAIFPKPVHSLPNGLTICSIVLYKFALSSDY